MVSRFVLQATMKTWQLRYCDADFAACERYRRNCCGMSVPADLLPNGKRLGGAGTQADGSDRGTRPLPDGARSGQRAHPYAQKSSDSGT